MGAGFFNRSIIPSGAACIAADVDTPVFDMLFSPGAACAFWASKLRICCTKLPTAKLAERRLAPLASAGALSVVVVTAFGVAATSKPDESGAKL